jgi:hypothetical protein
MALYRDESIYWIYSIYLSLSSSGTKDFFISLYVFYVGYNAYKYILDYMFLCIFLCEKEIRRGG